MTFYNDKPSINANVETNALHFSEKALAYNVSDSIGAKLWLQTTKAGIIFPYPLSQDKENPEWLQLPFLTPLKIHIFNHLAPTQTIEGDIQAFRHQVVATVYYSLLLSEGTDVDSVYCLNSLCSGFLEQILTGFKD